MPRPDLHKYTAQLLPWVTANLDLWWKNFSKLILIPQKSKFLCFHSSSIHSLASVPHIWILLSWNYCFTIIKENREDNTTRISLQPQSFTSRATFHPSTYLSRLALTGIKVGQQPKLTVRIFTAVLLKQAPFICRIYLSNIAPIYSRLFFTLSLNNRDKLRRITCKNKSCKSVRTHKSQLNEQNSHKCNLSFGPWP